MNKLFPRAVKAFQDYDEMHIRPTDEGLVRATIAAIEEPTEAMKTAASGVVPPQIAWAVWRIMHKALMDELGG